METREAANHHSASGLYCRERFKRRIIHRGEIRIGVP
jgi:hypothetical protein